MQTKRSSSGLIVKKTQHRYPKNKNRDRRRTPREEDNNQLFTRSLLPDFKKLSNKRKRGLKLKFATLLNEELNLAETEASSTLCSWASSSTSYYMNKMITILHHITSICYEMYYNIVQSYFACIGVSIKKKSGVSKRNKSTYSSYLKT